MKKITNITPGEILLEEFLKPLKITAYRLSKDTEMPATRVSQILKGNRRITADTALRLSQYFGNSADFWLGIQDEFDLREEVQRIGDLLDRIPKAVAINCLQN
ncbi:HigA family addiction module antitoxin [bacterium]|nr:HigA family addiction module antitoxin [bacterium]